MNLELHTHYSPMNRASYDVSFISMEPTIKLVTDMINEIEIQHILSLTRGNFSESKVLADEGSKSRSAGRSCSVCYIPPNTDDVSEALAGKIAAISEMPISNLEGFQLVRYRPGEEFTPHHDAFSPDNKTAKEELQKAGQRKSTTLIYLNTLPEEDSGGKTIFTELGIAVSAVAGTALVWNNVDKEGKIDMRLMHRASAPTLESKYVLVAWMRENEY